MEKKQKEKVIGVHYFTGGGKMLHDLPCSVLHWLTPMVFSWGIL